MPNADGEMLLMLLLLCGMWIEWLEHWHALLIVVCLFDAVATDAIDRDIEL